MTLQDQDAEVGRLARERRELREHYAALLARSRKIADLLNGIGHALAVQPASGPFPTVHFIVEGTTVNVAQEHYPQKIIAGEFPTADDLRVLLSEVKDAQGKLATLDASLKNFGL